MHGFAAASRVNLAVASCLTLALGACSIGGKKSTGTGPSGFGSLTVNVLPATGITPSVTVSGPNGYSHSLSATETIAGLTPGNYTIAATGGGSGRTTDPIVSAIDTLDIIGSPATVTAGSVASATVSYVRPGTGNLWIASTGTTMLAVAQPYSSAQLQAGNVQTAAYTLTFPDVSGGGSGAFDADGNLWLANSNNNAVEMYTPSQLVQSANLTAGVTITGSSLNLPVGLAFDALGNLWVANGGGTTVVEFTVGQIAVSGSPTAAVTLDGFSSPFQLAFDAAGNLWVPNSFTSTVVELTAAQLTASGTPTPAVTLSANANNSLEAPRGLAFDHTGNLWVANLIASTVVEYTTGQLAATGSPVPAVTLSGANTLNATSLAFDNSGNLWAATDSAVNEFTTSQIASSGSPTPAVTINLGATTVMFDLPPANLPLAAAGRLRARSK
jgi:hypothetical protein